MAGIDINLSKELLPGLLSSQDGLAEARRRLAEFREHFSKSAPKAVECLEAGFDDAMAVRALPDKYRKRLRITNMQERLNAEIRRQERVIRIFPNDERHYAWSAHCSQNRTRHG